MLSTLFLSSWWLEGQVWAENAWLPRRSVLECGSNGELAHSPWPRPVACSILCMPLVMSCTAWRFAFPEADLVAHTSTLCPCCINSCARPPEENWAGPGSRLETLGRENVWSHIPGKGPRRGDVWVWALLMEPLSSSPDWRHTAGQLVSVIPFPCFLIMWVFMPFLWVTLWCFLAFFFAPPYHVEAWERGGHADKDDSNLPSSLYPTSSPLWWHRPHGSAPC